MKFAYSLLKEYCDTPLDAKQLSNLLTAHGVKVESLEPAGDDFIVELEITANRPDCLSLTGVAREVNLLTKNSKAESPKCAHAGTRQFTSKELSPKTGQSFIQILNQQVCPIYIGRIIRNVKVAPSPDWLKRHVESFGMRSINNIVDITNLVLMETGQPLHAFDLDKLQEQKIIVRNAAKGEKIIAIDEKTYELQENDLVIADAARPVAIAGVMGGKLTEVGWSTKNILLESAYFQPGNIRKTSRRLKLASDSSYRFERGIDPKSVDINSRRAAELILQVAGGAVSDYQPLDYLNFKEATLTLRPERVKKILGIDIPTNEIKRILAGLGLIITDEPAKRQTNEQLNVTVPSFRPDICQEIDIIEELARVWGYNQIPVTAPRIELRVSAEDKNYETLQASREFFVESGYSEIMTNSFWDIPPAPADKPDQPLIPPEQITILGPEGNIDRILRTNLAKGMVEVFNTQENYFRTESKKLIKVFEISKVYFKDADARKERFHLGILDNGGFYSLKGIISGLLNFIGMAEKLSFKEAGGNISAYPKPYTGLENVTAIEINGAYAGYLGVLTVNQPQDILKANQPTVKIAITELDFEAITKAANLLKKYQAFSRFPESKRDIAVLVPEPTKWSEIEATARQAISASGKDVPLEKIEFFDLYRGKQIPTGQKSIAFSLSFRHNAKTLSSEDVDGVVKEVVAALGKNLQATLRA